MENKTETEQQFSNGRFCDYSGSLNLKAERDSITYIAKTGQMVFDFATSFAADTYGEIVITNTR